VAETTEKLVLSFDAETECFKPASHNLSAEQAVNLSRQFTDEGRTVKVVDQERHHLSLDPARCRSCKKAADEATRKHNETAASEPVNKDTNEAEC
jgi:hypothetical protein